MAIITPTKEEQELVARAAYEFGKYAVHDGPVAGFPPVRARQIEITRWAACLSVTNWCTAALGLGEEGCWELQDAIEADDTNATIDALGDIFIYAAHFSSMLRLDFATLVNHFDAMEPELMSWWHERPNGAMPELMRAVGCVSHCVLKETQKIRGYENPAFAKAQTGAMLARVLNGARYIAFAQIDVDAGVIFDAVAKKVLTRDWTANKIDGGVA